MRDAFVCVSIKITPTKSSHVNANLWICIDGDFRCEVAVSHQTKWFEKLKSPTTTFGFSGINISTIVMYCCDGKNDFLSIYFTFMFLFFKFHFDLICWFLSFDFSFFSIFILYCAELDKYGKLDGKIYRYFSLMQLNASTAAAATKRITAHQQCLQMQHELDAYIYIYMYKMIVPTWKLFIRFTNYAKSKINWDNTERNDPKNAKMDNNKQSINLKCHFHCG